MNLEDLPRPVGAFASDNQAGAHPAVLEALVAANTGHEPSYGYDRFTAATDEQFRALFDQDVDVFYVWSGTGANVMALTSLVGPAGAVVCSDWSHINVDETGAPERIAGCKLVDLPCPDGRMTADQLRSTFSLLGDEHHVQPQVLSITQSTELGTLYTVEQVRELCEVAHERGLVVHLDGARLANATAALGGTVEVLRALTVGAGVDVVSFGGTKNGLVHGEAVVYLDKRLSRNAKFVRKLVGQLPSKMRFIAAQFGALLSDDLWLHNAAHANAMARRLYDAIDTVPAGLDAPPVVNSLFPCLPRTVIDALQAWTPFYDWDLSRNQVRWMTAWDTTPEDVDRLAAAVRLLGAGGDA